MTLEYDITVDGTYQGSVHASSFGNAARSAMLTLGLNEVDTLTVTRMHVGHTTLLQSTYYTCFLDSQTSLVYELVTRKAEKLS